MATDHLALQPTLDLPQALMGGGIVVGGFPVRLAQTPEDMDQVLALRRDRFAVTAPGQSDRDRFDSLSTHLMVCRPDAKQVLATARLRLLRQGADFAQTYTGQFYDMTALSRSYGRALEIGRLCQASDAQNMADALRALLAAVTLICVHTRAEVLFGCTSFRGQDVQAHGAALTWLRTRHLGPVDLRPQRMHPRAVDFPHGDADPHAQKQALPALLRMYLGMGGWVSDHAIIDPELDTLHVFTAVATATIPPARLRALRALCPV
ncbi:GNAT family N-acetyltransferase [Roseinatronobacter sp. NSM]|uniref:GNAT family N-acetyltransferase n=1 Tax=Roseinatronobacter sp. NSM TaxID=3457785 RepID=UPI0040368B94